MDGRLFENVRPADLKVIWLCVVFLGILCCQRADDQDRSAKKHPVAGEHWSVTRLGHSGYYGKAPYDFLRPDETHVMPDILREISGIVPAGPDKLYCIQDEEGIVFKYDTDRKEVTGLIRFAGKGDFEDLTIKEDSVFVLRSDGVVFSLPVESGFDGESTRQVLPVNCPDVEGLTFDPVANVMYLACKAPLNDAGKMLRQVYRMLPGHPNVPEPAWTINVDEINDLIAARYPSSEKRKVSFNPSAIAIHPQTGEKYVLSASDRMIAVFTGNGLARIYPLPAELYYKPEGMAFTSDGGLFISSEGMKSQSDRGKIFFFRRKVTGQTNH